MNSLMIFCPVYRLEPETVDAIKALQWSGPITVVYQNDNPYTSGRANILHQYQRGRDLFLSGDYDAMVTIESDIIPPSHALTALAAADADIAYGVYRFRHSNHVNVTAADTGAQVRGPSITHTGDWPALANTGVIACSGSGLGCAMIIRPVLEMIPFRRGGENGPNCDTYFSDDCYRLGFRMRAHTGVLCGHKDEEGAIQWPT